MPYSEELADRIREAIDPALESHRLSLHEINMFGGLCFMVRGHMCCGVIEDSLMLRLGRDGATEALGRRHTRPMDFTGTPMKTMVFIDPAGMRTRAALRAWLNRAVAFNLTLAPKNSAP